MPTGWIVTSENIRLALDILIKTTLLLLITYIATRLAAKASAAFRHLLWTLAVIAVLVTPIIGPALPHISLPLFYRDLLDMDIVGPTADYQKQIPTGDFMAAWLREFGGQALFEFNDQSVKDARLKASASANPEHSPAFRWPEIVLFIWLAGSAVFLVINLFGMHIARRVIRQASDAEQGEKNMGFLLARLLKIKRAIRFLRADSLFAPFTIGLIKAKVVLNNRKHNDPESVEAVLLHELAHVKRNDVLTQMLARTACVLFWFNPLVWIAARRMMIERELACDDFVLNHGGRPSSYAQQLLELASVCRPVRRPSWATVAMARRNHFRERVMSILNPKINRRGAGRVTSIATAMAAMVIILPLAAMQFWSASPAIVKAAKSVAPVIQKGTTEDAIELKAGDIFKRYRPYLFKIKSFEPLTGVKATFIGREFTFKKQDDSIWDGLTAIGQEVAAGPQTILLKVTYTDGRVKEYSKTIQVETEPKDFYTVSLENTLDLEKRKMMYLNQKEEEVLGRLFSHSTDNQKWNWPFIMPAEGKVSLPFHATIILDKDKRISHDGVDLSLPENTPIKASNSGLVVLVEENPVRGNMVVIDHGGGIFTGYMHLSQVSVTKGEEVEQGQVIGLAGSTGISTGPHLHWFLNINGIYCDPMKLIDSSN
jgi:murein DD-endopeptidase MepM/ murein hydrolase activator NlpD